MPFSQPSEREIQARDRLIVALDVPTLGRARVLAGDLRGVCRWVKVGLELYLAAGNAVISELADKGYSVFLDLKFHDIPNTVAGAVRSAASVGASLLTVHAAGGPAMLSAAAEAAAASPQGPRILAVTVLTSMDRAQLAAVGMSGPPVDQVLRLARIASASGIDGLVCSAAEARAVRRELGPQVYLVTPGIRPAGAESDDQKRVTTPAEAIRAGANAVVVGRPITQAMEPARAAQAIIDELEDAGKRA